VFLGFGRVCSILERAAVLTAITNQIVSLSSFNHINYERKLLPQNQNPTSQKQQNSPKQQACPRQTL
jgi:hypothetical protein